MRNGYEYVKQKIDKKCTSLYIFYRRVLSCAQNIAFAWNHRHPEAVNIVWVLLQIGGADVQWNRQARKERQGKIKDYVIKTSLKIPLRSLRPLRLNKKNSSYKIEVIVV